MWREVASLCNNWFNYPTNIIKPFSYSTPATASVHLDSFHLTESWKVFFWPKVNLDGSNLVTARHSCSSLVSRPLMHCAQWRRRTGRSGRHPRLVPPCHVTIPFYIPYHIIYHTIPCNHTIPHTIPCWTIRPLNHIHGHFLPIVRCAVKTAIRRHKYTSLKIWPSRENKFYPS